ncbi:carboxypeptidase-like regulatory domain-containing protein [Planctomycetota bacterium]
MDSGRHPTLKRLALWGVPLCLLLAAAAGRGEPIRKVLWGFPTRAPHEETKHKNEGRIVGLVKECPGCRIEIFTTNQGVVQTIELNVGEGEYTSAWLDTGDYTIRLSADGWPILNCPGLTVENGSDTSINFGFLERQPKPRDSGDLSIPDDIERMPDWKPDKGPTIPKTDFKPGIPKFDGDRDKSRDKNNKNKGKKGKGKKGRKKGKKGRKNNRNKGVKMLGGS